MSEADVVARSVDGPVTLAQLVRELTSLGVKPGMLLMVHSSMSAIGWVPGGVQTVAAALREVVGPEGTLMMPGFNSANNEPSLWREPPVPEDWWEVIRAETPAFDPLLTPTREMGALVEYFRTLQGTLRSGHPYASWSANGPLAPDVTATHSLNMGLSDDNPYGHAYRLGAYVLSLGCVRTSILHLSDFLTDWPGREISHRGSAMYVDGERRWVEYDEVFSDAEDFEAIRLAYMQHCNDWSSGKVGYADSRLFPVRPLVDFAVKWISVNRR